MTLTYLICAPTGHFADDVADRCATCDAPIVHRPHAPPNAVPICLECAAQVLEQRPDATIEITEETRCEIALHRAPTRGTH